MAEELQSELGQNGTHNGESTSTMPHKHQRNGTDPDAQEMVISSLRGQIQDLFTQVTQLNGKLVNSYDRVSDLEDDLHVASSNLRSSSLKISQLELERTQHLSALNTGLLVEKSHVTAELNRLMEKATEEAAQRGQAESARHAIEKDLDDLSATLFGQANTMVAEARYARALSERKVEEAEQALKGAEEAVAIMQQQMQAMQAEREEAEKKAQEMQMTMGKGNWVEKDGGGSLTRSVRLLSSHAPYQEFLLFVAHLRSIHPTSPQLPAMATLLTLPFLARLHSEDSEPTVRLDLAPSLNWLSRRTVLGAIHNGQLTIEPMSSSTLLHESASPYSSSANIPGLNSSQNNISCALCGTPIFSTPDSPHSIHNRPPSHPSGVNHSHNNSNSWSTALFKKPSLPSSGFTSRAETPIPSSFVNHPNGPPSQPYPPQVFIFCQASPPQNAISNIPIPSIPSISTSTFAASSQPPHHPQSHMPQPSPTPSPQSSTIYPLCSNGWCLARLRTTCTLWAFIRAGIIEKVWEEEVPTLMPPPISRTSSANGEKPPVPPRRRGLWGMASAIGERAASWGEGDKEKTKKAQAQGKVLPSTPPPTHSDLASVTAPKPTVAHPPPPPLPKRSDIRRTVTPNPPPAPPAPPVLEAGAQATSEVLFSADIDTNPSERNSMEKTLPPSTPTLAENVPIPATPTRLQHIQRPVTPSSVPLPISRSTTPVVASPPSRTASPVPTGGAAPPPLPRRAAARAPRPVSVSREQEFASPASPATPARSRLSTELHPSGGIVKEDAVPVPDQPQLQVAEPDSVPPSAEHGPISLSTEETTTAVQDAQPEQHVPLEAPTMTRGNSEEDVFMDALSDGKTPSGEGSPAFNGQNQENVGGEEKVASPIDAVNETIAAKEDVGSSARTPNDAENDTVDVDDTNKEEDKEVYVGIATWEERTWQELVRLREAMFWARIGGLR